MIGERNTKLQAENYETNLMKWPQTFMRGISYGSAHIRDMPRASFHARMDAAVTRRRHTAIHAATDRRSPDLLRWAELDDFPEEDPR